MPNQRPNAAAVKAGAEDEMDGPTVWEMIRPKITDEEYQRLDDMVMGCARVIARQGDTITTVTAERDAARADVEWLAGLLQQVQVRGGVVCVACINPICTFSAHPHLHEVQNGTITSTIASEVPHA